MSKDWPILGCGVGLRNEHYAYVTKQKPKVDWFEAISENFMTSGGRPLAILEKVREHYPIILHGTSLSIASSDPLSKDYLEKLKILVDRVDPALVSDHLCWGGIDEHRLHDLLPLPFTEETLRHVVNRVQEVQDFLGRKILLENVSTYLTFKHSEMKEWEFIEQVAERSGCGLLLDLNNIYVNAYNHEFNPTDYLNGISGKHVGQFHLAGHTDKGGYLFDTHTGTVIEEVWKLYEEALKRWGKVSTLIEWDEAVPDFPTLLAEVSKAKSYYALASNRVEAEQDARTPVNELSSSTHEKPTLLETQRWFKEKMLPGKTAKFVGQEIELNLQRSTPGKERLSVYADGYLGRTYEALSEVFQATGHMIGEHPFMHIAEEYAESVPSREYNLSLCGRHFPTFIQTHKISKSLPFLKDLAQLEWFISMSFHAFEKQTLDAATFAKIDPNDWEKTRFTLQPSVKVCSSEWPILDIWQARKTPIKEINLKVEGNPQNVLMYRINQNVRCELISETQYNVLCWLLEGRTFGVICSLLAEVEGEEPELQQWLGYWLSLGFFAGFEITQNPEVCS